MDKKTKLYWKIVTVLSLGLYLAFSIIFVVWGRVNDDEGFYLYASKLVYEGKIPYQEFAYTQTPLLPYIYGAVQRIFYPSIYLGRVTSFFFTGIACFLAIAVARKYKGDAAGGVTALLWATFTYGIYYHSIVKTYPLVTLFFILTLFTYTSHIKREWRLILTSIFVMLAILTRLSALLFAVPIIIFNLLEASNKSRVIIISICLSSIVWILFLSFPNNNAILWNQVKHHTDRWGDVTNLEKLREIIFIRIPSILLAFPIYSLLVVTVITMGFASIQEFLKRNRSLLVALLGLLLFALSHFGTGGWYIEYFFTFLFVLFPLAGILYVEVYDKQICKTNLIIRAVYKATLLSALIAGILLGALNESFVEISNSQTPIQERREIAVFVADNSDINDGVFALSPLDVVVEANRRTLPGMSMAIFSYFSGETVLATNLKLVNDQIIAEYLTNAVPKVIILTSVDWKILQSNKEIDNILASLAQNYSLRLKREEFGTYKEGIEVYIRSDAQ